MVMTSKDKKFNKTQIKKRRLVEPAEVEPNYRTTRFNHNGQGTIIEMDKEETMPEVEMSHLSTLNVQSQNRTNAEQRLDEIESRCKTAPSEIIMIRSGDTTNNAS